MLKNYLFNCVIKIIEDEMKKMKNENEIQIILPSILYKNL